MSNSDSRGYWRDPDREGGRSARPSGKREDPYARGAGYGGQAGGYRRGAGRDGSGRDGSGRDGSGRDGSGQNNGYSRGSGYGRGGVSRRDGASRGDGVSRRDGASGRDGGYGRSGGSGYQPREGYRNSSFAVSRGDDDAYSRRRSGGGRGTSQTGSARGPANGGDSGYGRGAGSRSAAGSGNGRGSYGSRDGYGSGSRDGRGARDEYGEARGYQRGYRDSTSWRSVTGARDRFAQRFTDFRTRSGRGAGGGSDDGRGGSKRVRRKGDWWRHWTWKKALGVCAAVAGGFILLGIGAVIYAYETTPIPSAASETALAQSSTVYYSNGTEVGTFSDNGIDRQLVSENQIPAVMDNAMIAAEDRNFYHEGGISLTGIARAFEVDLRGGNYAQGGSTITQQFVRNYYATIGTQQTLSRKIKEIFVSIKLSHQKSKGWVLTQYLNTVPFGENSYGINAAAETYFDETPMQLTTSQAAMLAAMPNEPGFFDPTPGTPGYKPLVARWHYVLTNMVRDGVLTQAQANAQKFPAVVSTANTVVSSYTGYKGYIMDAVENELEKTYGFSDEAIHSDGLKIVTTFNENLMNGVYSAVQANEAKMTADGQSLPSYAHVGVVIEQPGTGAILAMDGGPGEDMSQSQCQVLLCDDNTATQDREQVGSSFKPYVLATAVSEGMDVQDSVINAIEPMCVPPDTEPLVLSTKSTNCPPGWFPINLPGENLGAISVAEATAESSDPGYEDLIHHAGTQATINMAQAFGVNTAPLSQGGSGLQGEEGDVGIALGISSLTVEEQATTFATLAADGEWSTPHVIAQLTRSDGTTIPLKVAHREVLTPVQAADVDYALSFDTVYGTAFPNGVLDPVRPTIAKTGTTDNAESAFFIGAIPQYSVAVGIFTNEQDNKTDCGSLTVNSNPPCGQTLNILPSINGQLGGYGGAWPTMIWHTIMQNEFSSLPVEQLPTPNYNGFTKWNQVTGDSTATPTPTPSGGSPSPSPSPSQCPPGEINGFGKCRGGGGPTPTPTPSPSPSPTPSVPPPGPVNSPPGGRNGPGG